MLNFTEHFARFLEILVLGRSHHERLQPQLLLRVDNIGAAKAVAAEIWQRMIQNVKNTHNKILKLFFSYFPERNLTGG
jgi:hypothetical protein